MRRAQTGTDPRQRMIRSAALLFRERGVEGTSFSDVLEHSRAPRGSIYHHFPGGKAELAEEATRYAGEVMAGGLADALVGDDPVSGLHTFIERWSAGLAGSGFAGCPIVAATLEGDRSPAARDRARAAFRSWETIIARALEGRGVSADRARSVATTAIAAIEGGIVLSRAERSISPLDRVASEVERLAAAALAEAAQPSPRGDPAV